MNTTVLMEAAEAMSLGERLAYGAQVMLIGMATIFLSLTILWGVIAIFKVFMYDIPQKKAKAKAEAELATAVSEHDGDADESEEADALNDDAQLVAVITAAIAAYQSQSGTVSNGFRVVSYKRVRNAGGWSGSDISETI